MLSVCFVAERLSRSLSALTSAKKLASALFEPLRALCAKAMVGSLLLRLGLIDAAFLAVAGP